MENKRDRRIQYTKKNLREALIALLKEKTINEVSISELCKAADINRNTFYNHYSIPLDILQEIENEVYQNIIDKTKELKNIEDIIYLSCQLLQEDKDLSILIFTKADGRAILSRVLLHFRQNSPIHQHIELTPEIQPLIDMAYEFGEQGTIAVIQSWVKNDFNIPAKIIAQMISYIVGKINNIA